MTYIKTEPVSPVSSMIAEIGYDRKMQTLRVVFHKNGAVYDYPTFPERDWDAFLAAESKGKYFHRAIKPVFGHRRASASETKEPCCDHAGKACDDSCLPCDPSCCAGISTAQREHRAAALTHGLEGGRRLIESAQGSASPTAEDACKHPNKESSKDGSYMVCSDCQANLSPVTVEETTTDEDKLPALACNKCGGVSSPAAYQTGDACEKDVCVDGVLV